MATTNPFDLLGDYDHDDPSQLIAAEQQKLAPPATKKAPTTAQGAAAQQAKPAPKMLSKSLPPAQAVREAKGDNFRGGRSGRGSSRGRGGRGFNRDFPDGEISYGGNNGFSGGYRPPEDGDAGRPFERRGPGGPRGGFRGGRRGGFIDGDAAEGERTRRPYERRSGTGRGNEIKREGAGRGNWGTPADEIAPETEEPANEVEKNENTEKQTGEEDAGDANKENPVNESEVKEPEDKEMTLEEYEKVLEEKRKALLSTKAYERKVELDKELQKMQLLSSKKNDEDVFIKLGSEKDKRKEAADKEERARKAVSINEFLKPAEGEGYYRPGGRGRGRGRGGGRGGNGGNNLNSGANLSIEDVAQFPSLGGGAK